MGDKRRWRTMPWMVTFFGILVVPLGVVSITPQHSSCAACRRSAYACLIAAAMFDAISLTLDARVATLAKFLFLSCESGHKNSECPGRQIPWIRWHARNTPEAAAVSVRADVVSPAAMVQRVTCVSGACSLAWRWDSGWIRSRCPRSATWHRLPASDHLVGALIVTAAVIALADVGRAARFINILFGALVIIAPWLLSGATASARWNDLIAGALVILLSFPRGKIGER